MEEKRVKQTAALTALLVALAWVFGVAAFGQEVVIAPQHEAADIRRGGISGLYVDAHLQANSGIVIAPHEAEVIRSIHTKELAIAREIEQQKLNHADVEVIQHAQLQQAQLLKRELDFMEELRQRYIVIHVSKGPKPPYGRYKPGFESGRFRLIDNESVMVPD